MVVTRRNLNLFSVFLLSLMAIQMEAQTITNGNFSSSTSNWNCSPEVNLETVYGGSNGANYVAEIDTVAGLCQTISGFTIGTTYTLRFDCARRVGSPALKSMNVTIDGGALSASVSRNGTPFSLTNESFNFVATATTHTLQLTGTSAGTLGLLVDNMSISTATILPIRLLVFDAEIAGQTINVSWFTSLEIDNNFFVLERSVDGQEWTALQRVEGAGNSTHKLDYQLVDETPLMGYNYYRLEQVDFNGHCTYFTIIVSEFHPSLNIFSKVISYPNPATNHIKIVGTLSERSVIKLANLAGQDVTSFVRIYTRKTYSLIDVSQLASGYYLLRTQTKTSRIRKK